MYGTVARMRLKPGMEATLKDERFRKMRALLAADPEWRDGEIIAADSA